MTCETRYRPTTAAAAGIDSAGGAGNAVEAAVLAGLHRLLDGHYADTDQAVLAALTLIQRLRNEVWWLKHELRLRRMG